MDGKNQRVILDLTGDSYPSGLTVHHISANQSRLYFTDIYAPGVFYIDLDSNQKRQFITSELLYPVDLITYGNNLYVTDAGGGGAWDGGVYSALLGGSSNVSKVIDLMKYVWGIDSYDLGNIYSPGRFLLTTAALTVYRSTCFTPSFVCIRSVS